MPARGAFRATDIPSEVLIDLARNPDKFEAGIKRWQKVEGDVQREQARLHELEAKVNAERDALEAQIADFDASSAQRQKDLDKFEESLNQRETKIERHTERDAEQRVRDRARQADLEALERRLGEWDTSLTQRQNAIQSREASLADEIKALAKARDEFEAERALYQSKLRDLRERIRDFRL